MKQVYVLALSVALSSWGVGSPSLAFDMSNIVRNVSGNLGEWSDFDRRKHELRKAIDAAVTGGQLSNNQAGEFGKQLDALTEAETKAQAGGKLMGFVESISFNNQLNAIANQLQLAMEQHVASLPNVDEWQAGLEKRVDADLAGGKLGAPDAAAIRSDLQNLAGIERAYRQETGGNLTPKQIELLAFQTNAVKSKLEGQEQLNASGVPAIDGRRAALEVKIAEAIRSGSLSLEDGNGFRRDLAKIAAQESTFQSGSNGLLTGSQVLQLAQDLDGLNGRLDGRMAMANARPPAPPVIAATVPPPVVTRTTVVVTSNIDTRIHDLHERIQRLGQSGKIPTSTVEDYRTQLEQTRQLEAAYQAAPNGITAEQVAQLTKSLDRLDRRLDEQVDNAAAPGPNPGMQTFASYNGPTKSFADCTGYWGQPYVEVLAGSGVIGGFPDGSFHPNDNITRAQFAAIAVHALGLPDAGGAPNNFVDVKPAYWAARAIASASNAGLITGFPDGTFKPENQLTRAQALVILAKALRSNSAPPDALNGYADSAAIPPWAQPSVAQAAKSRIIVNYPDPSQIRPNALATRGEVAAMVYQTLCKTGGKLPPLRIGVLDTNGPPVR